MAENTPLSRARRGVLIALATLAFIAVGSGALGGLSHNHSARILWGAAALFCCIALNLGLVFLGTFKASRTEQAIHCMAFGAVICSSFAGWLEKPSVSTYAVAVPIGVALGLAMFLRYYKYYKA
ncbi:MAG: hypothetical protein J0I28_08610 [Caulobacterales bacterium]|nr:hypothetical protein [Caulobacterales bacterium]